MLKQLRVRPLMCICLTFLGLSFTAAHLPSAARVVFSVLFLLLAILNAVFGKHLPFKSYRTAGLRHTVTVLLLSAFAASFLSFLTFDCRAGSFGRADGKEDTVTLEIAETVYVNSYGARYRAEIGESALLGKSFSVFLDSGDVSLLPGDVLAGSLLYHVPEENKDGFDEVRYAYTRNVFLTAEDISLRYIRHNSDRSLSERLAELNSTLCGLLRHHTEESGLPSAVLLGNRRDLSDTMERDFKRLGITHILSLSGAHLAILSALLERFLLRLRVRKKARAGITVAACIFFMALTGNPSSLTRAGLMLIIANLSCFFRRKADYPTSLALACALIVAVSPTAALDIGLHLSFAASHSCYISSRLSYHSLSRFGAKNAKLPNALRKTVRRSLRSLLSTVFFNIVISVNMLPLLWLYFGEMSLLSLPANLFYLPLITLLMYVTIAFFLLYPLRIFTVPVAGLITALTRFIGDSAAFLSSLPGIVLSLNRWFAPIFLIPMILMVIAAFGCSRKTAGRVMKINVLLFLAFLGCTLVEQVRDLHTIEAEYVTEGKNDGLLLRSDGKLLACEISTGSYVFASYLANHAADLRCTEIEIYMLTHYHTRQVSALHRLTDNVILRTLVLPTPVTETDRSVFSSLYSMAEEKGINILLTDRQTTADISFGEVTVTTYPYTILSRSTHPVIAVRIEADDGTLMYLGGSFNEAYSGIMKDAAEAEYLIFGGHSPVYKKAFDTAALAESKTVYVSEYMAEDLMKLTGEVSLLPETGERLLPATPFRLSE